MTDTEKKFENWLDEYGCATCPCGHKFTLDDVDYSNGSTECGTEWTFVEIECPSCGKELVSASTWWPGASNINEVVENVLPDVEIEPSQ